MAQEWTLGGNASSESEEEELDMDYLFKSALDVGSHFLDIEP